MKFVTGHFECDGGLIYLPIGFVPDYFFMCDASYTTATVFYHWWKALEEDAFTTALEGFKVSQGVTADLATTAGISAYDTGTQAPTVTAWSKAVSDAATARTATARGTLVKPTGTANNADGQLADRSAVLECVTAGTGAATEPAWPLGIGDQITDGTTVFELVNQPTFRAGYQGVAIAAALMTNGDEHFYNAWLADESVDWGDVDGWASGVYGG
jgi:hypothetical protein